MIKLKIIATIFGYLLAVTSFSADLNGYAPGTQKDSNQLSKEIDINYDALLIVDANPFDNFDSYNKITVPAFLRAIKNATEKNRPIILVNFQFSSAISKIMDLIKGLPNGYPFKEIVKEEFSAFSKTDLEKYLNENNIENIFIIGTSTNVCIRSTILDGIVLGFKFSSSSDFLDDGLPLIPDNLQYGFHSF